jgi:heme-degrading monooxygenase HmoA/GNAT superfamily N-acetyltransferase
MYAIIFTSVLAPHQDGSYTTMADAMDRLVATQPGFLHATSRRNPDGSGCTLSYWASYDAIRAWKHHPEHQQAKYLGKHQWYTSYHVDCIHLRHYTHDDAETIGTLFYNTIHQSTGSDYTVAQRDAWAPHATKYPEGWHTKLRALHTWVAVRDATIVGLVAYTLEGPEGQEGYVDLLYVHHAHQRRGIGAALLGVAVHAAHAAQVPRVTAAASITAKPCFEAQQFTVIRPQTVTRHGVVLQNFLMERRLYAL